MESSGLKKELCVVVHEGELHHMVHRKRWMLYEQALLVADDENLPQDRAAYDELVAYEKSLKIEKRQAKQTASGDRFLAEHTG